MNDWGAKSVCNYRSLLLSNPYWMYLHIDVSNLMHFVCIYVYVITRERNTSLFRCFFGCRCQKSVSASSSPVFVEIYITTKYVEMKEKALEQVNEWVDVTIHYPFERFVPLHFFPTAWHPHSVTFTFISHTYNCYTMFKKIQT